MAFRIGTHMLAIEVGSYKNVQSMNRLCKVCTLNEVEDEKDLLFCSSVRIQFFANLCKPFTALSQGSQLFLG